MDKWGASFNMDPNWVIAIATTVYVVLTAVICWSNLKAAKASKEQTEELVLQRKMTNRPNVVVSFQIIRSSLMAFVIENTGMSAAERLHVRLGNEFIDNLPENMRERVRSINGSELFLVPGQRIVIAIAGQSDFGKVSEVVAVFDIDYNGGEYSGHLEIDISQYGFALIENGPAERSAKALEKLAKQVDEGNGALVKAIRRGLPEIRVVQRDADQHDRNKAAVFSAICTAGQAAPVELSEKTGIPIEEVRQCIADLCLTDGLIGTYGGFSSSNPSDNSIWFKR